MSLDKRNISISFGQGIDTKTDPNQVMAGKLLSLQNATLSETQELKKRFGFNSIVPGLTYPSSAIPLNLQLGTFNNELITMDSKSLFTYNPTLNTNSFVDNLIAVEPYVTQIDRTAGGDINPDSAYNQINNTYLYTWCSSAVPVGGNYINLNQAFTSFAVYSGVGSRIYSGTIQGLVRSKAFSVGSNFIISGISPASSSINTYEFSALASSANILQTSAVVGIVGGTQFEGSSAGSLQFPIYHRYDGTVLNGTLFLSYFIRGTSAIGVSQVTQNGIVASSVICTGDASGALGVFGDAQNYWTIFYNGVSSSAQFFTLPSTAANKSNPSPTNFAINVGGLTSQLGSPIQFTGTSQTNGPNLSANVYYQVYNKPQSQAVQTSSAIQLQGVAPRSDYIVKQSLDGLNLASSGSSAIVIRSLGLSSKAFSYNGDDFLLAAYGCNSNGNLTSNAVNGNGTAVLANRLEPTYFLITPTKQNKVAMKLAYQNGAGYDFPFFIPNASGQNNLFGPELALPLSNINYISSSSLFQTSYLFKSQQTQIGTNNFVPIVYGVNSTTLNFNSINSYANLALGKRLNIAGGFLSSYDGTNVIENNFHLYPEDCQLASGTSGSGGTVGIQANTYSYKFIYEQIDNFGNIERSTPSIAYNINVNNQVINIAVPSIKVTNKKNIVVRMFRNAPSIDSLTFHDIAPNSPIQNSTGIDYLNFIDNASDASIIGNPILYTAGGILQDSGAPSPVAMSQYKDRLFMVDAENRTTEWYSKEIIDGVPVEMSNLQTLFLTSKYGDITATIEMDDKHVIFRSNNVENAIQYITGIGPDATGANSDYGLPVLITTTVSTTNPRSVVLTPDGVMFQSNKGIWLLGRDLAVNYIGAPVESFNIYQVTSARLVPNTTQVRFTLNNGFSLVWDYYQRQWSVFTNINAIHSVIFQNLFTYLGQVNSQGLILQETPGFYSDNGNPILVSLQTSWLAPAALQGLQRIWRAYLMGRYVSPHLLNVSVGYDYNPNVSQTSVINPQSNQNTNYGSQPYYGASNFYGGFSPLSQNRINFKKQKCQSFQITIQEQLYPLNPVLGAGVELENINLVFGAKLPYPKLPASLTVK